jgi:DNA-directed RNA polymerase specialized sigma24 family protein
MEQFQSQTDWTANKDSEAIVYSHSGDIKVEVTLNDFIKNCRTPEEIAQRTAEFYRFKEISDKLFHEEDVRERKNDKNTLPIYEWSEKLVSVALEDQLIGEVEKAERDFYERRIEVLRNKLPILLDKLTPKQFNRMKLRKIDKLSLREIAKMEGVSFEAVEQSIGYIEKKIAKILAKD